MIVDKVNLGFDAGTCRYLYELRLYDVYFLNLSV